MSISTSRIPNLFAACFLTSAQFAIFPATAPSKILPVAIGLLFDVQSRFWSIDAEFSFAHLYSRKNTW